MFFSSSKKDEGRVIGVIDIGSAQVSATIVKIKKEREIESVLAQTDEKIAYQGLPTFEHFWSVTEKATKTALQELKTSTKVEPDTIYLFLSSPFFQSQTKIIKIDNASPVKITKNYIANLVHQADSQLNLGENAVIIEDKVMQTKLDGYITTWPLGQKAKEIELSRFISWADKALLTNLLNLIHSEYAKARVIFNTFSFATYDIFKDFLPDKDFILLDTGNEITDVLIIKDNVLVEHFSFPKGKNFLTRKLAAELSTIPAEVETSLSLYVTNQANPQLKIRLEPALAKVSALWQTDFKEALSKALETTLLPETIYLIGDDPIDSLFARFIEEANFNEITLSNHKLTAVFVEKLLAEGLVHLTGQVQPLTNSWLLAETLFCAKVN